MIGVVVDEKIGWMMIEVWEDDDYDYFCFLIKNNNIVSKLFYI